MKCLRHLKKKEDDGRNTSLLVFTCSHGRFMRETRERKNICIRHSFEKKKMYVYIYIYIYTGEKSMRMCIFVASYCLDIGALIFTTMYQLPSYYLHNIVAPLV